MTETKLVYSAGNYSILLLQESNQSPNLASAALLILLVFTLLLNSLVLLSILVSPLRSSAQNAAISTIAGASLVDGVFNLTTSIVFHASWPELTHFYGEDTVRVWCRSNATILQITGAVLGFALAVLSYDILSIVKDRQAVNISPRRKVRLRTALKLVLLLSVFGSAILAFPIAFGVLDTTLFEQRMSCSPTYAIKQPESVLIAVVILIIHLATWIFIFRNCYIFMRKVLDESRRLIGLELVARRRAVELGGPPQGITNSNSNSAFWCQIWGTGNGEDPPAYILTGLLIASFVLTVVPNVIAVQVTQFYTAYDIGQEFYVVNRTLSQTDLAQIQTDVFDSIFAWARHGYNVISPGLILVMHGEIRKHCKLNFCCCCVGRNTLVRKQPRSVPAFVRQWKSKKKNKTVADYRTPVLFATSEGLYLRTLRGDLLQHEEPQFILKFCDLTRDDGKALSKQQTQVQSRQQTKLSETSAIK